MSFQSLPPCGPPFPSRNEKVHPWNRKDGPKKITVNWISEHHLPHFFFAGSMFQLKVNWGPKWFGILESPPNDLWDWNPWVFFPLRIPEPPFAPNQQINQLGLISNSSEIHENSHSASGCFQKLIRYLNPQGFKVNTTSRSMGSRQSCVRPKPPVVWAPWICSGAQTRSVGWMDGWWETGWFWRGWVFLHEEWSFL